MLLIVILTPVLLIAVPLALAAYEDRIIGREAAALRRKLKVAN